MANWGDFSAVPLDIQQLPMARTKKKKAAAAPKKSDNEGWQDVVAISLIGIGLVIFMALLSYDPRDLPAWVGFSVADRPQSPIQNFIGPLGALFAGYSFFILGAAAYLLPAGLIWFGVSKLLSGFKVRWRPVVGFCIFLVAGACLLQLQTLILGDWREEYKNLGPGGGIGYLLGDLILVNVIGGMGSTMVALIAYVIGLVMMTGMHPVEFMWMAKEALANYRERRAERRAEAAAAAEEEYEYEYEEPAPKPKRKTPRKKP